MYKIIIEKAEGFILTLSNIFLTLFTLLLIIWLKLYNIVATNDDLLFLLIPTKFLVEIYTSTTALYTDSGYFFELLNITIDKSCAGVNFFILSFSLFAFTGFTYLDRIFQKIIAIFVAIFLEYNRLRSPDLFEPILIP